MTASRSNWMDAEDTLLDRIRSRVPAGTHVILEADMPEDYDDLPLPVVILKYDGFSPLKESPDGLSASIRAEWIALVGDRVGSEQDMAGPARARLSNLAGTVLRAVMGFRLPDMPHPVTPSKTAGSFPVKGLIFHPVGFGFTFVALGDGHD